MGCGQRERERRRGEELVESEAGYLGCVGKFEGEKYVIDGPAWPL